MADAVIIRLRPMIITLRQLKLSAIAPTKMARMNAGDVEDAWTNATITSEVERVAISQLIATACISRPRLEN
ncbi:hypothetical protein GGE67_005797 [Rhizobium leucaenae]|nr:hypothetical protein [Rhizobium leucaenae]